MEDLTPEMNYRFTIIEAIDFLNQTKNEMLIKLVNVAMAGEFNDINSTFEEGDEIPADISYFKNCDDKNVQALLNQIKTIQYTIEYLMNWNNIQESDLGIKVI